MTVAVSDLLIERDLYYRAESVPNEAGNFSNSDHEIDENYRLRELLDDPQKWGEVYEGFARKGGAEFHELGSDEFFVMGDNSPRSQDSRLWPNQVRRAVNRHAVNRQALIGKAFFIYWPHGVPFLNGGKGITLLSHKSVPRPEPGNQFERDIAKAEANEAAEYPEYSIPFYPQWWRWKRIR